MEISQLKIKSGVYLANMVWVTSESADIQRHTKCKKVIKIRYCKHKMKRENELYSSENVVK
jgi:hypothetical protein